MVYKKLAVYSIKEIKNINYFKTVVIKNYIMTVFLYSDSSEPSLLIEICTLGDFSLLTVLAGVLPQSELVYTLAIFLDPWLLLKKEGGAMAWGGGVVQVPLLHQLHFFLDQQALLKVTRTLVTSQFYTETFVLYLIFKWYFRKKIYI